MTDAQNVNTGTAAKSAEQTVNSAQHFILVLVVQVWK